MGETGASCTKGEGEGGRHVCRQGEVCHLCLQEKDGGNRRTGEGAGQDRGDGERFGRHQAGQHGWLLQAPVQTNIWRGERSEGTNQGGGDRGTEGCQGEGGVKEVEGGGGGRGRRLEGEAGGGC